MADMATTRERREARAERLRGWAESREAKAEGAYEKVKAISDMIPLGQPILVGHHSEGRHRRDLGRIESGMRASIEHQAKADSMRSRAANIEAAAERAIYSDDDDAIEKLEARIAGLEAERDRIKAYNKTARAGKPDLSILNAAEVRSLESEARFMPSVAERRKHQMPGYVLSNLGGNITKQKQRLAQLQRKAGQS